MNNVVEMPPRATGLVLTVTPERVPVQTELRLCRGQQISAKFYHELQHWARGGLTIDHKSDPKGRHILKFDHITCDRTTEEITVHLAKHGIKVDEEAQLKVA